MIKITFRPDDFDVVVDGHADFAEKGNDIVCSAVSTLFYTLGQTLFESREMLSEDVIFEDKDGKGHLKCVPKSEYVGNIARSFLTIMQGFLLVAGNYPDNVKVFLK